MNKKFKQFSTFLLLLIFSISLPVSIYILKTGNFDFRISAFDSDEPVNVMLTDKTSTSFKVLWLTQKKVFGAVKINETNDLISENYETNSHFLQINNLQPNTSYTITIYSGTKEFPQNIIFNTLTSHVPQDANYLIFGQVFDKSGTKVQQEGIVTIELKDNTSSSEILGTTINESGGFQFNLKNMVSLNTGNYFSYNRKLDSVITIYPAPGEAPIIKTYTYDFTYQKQIPNIYLGDISLDVIPGVSE